MNTSSNTNTAELDPQGYKARFIEFMVECEVLTFGDFTTKAGRATPYFINTGKYRTGSQMKQLASFYADAIQANAALGYDMLFGPAYKGIPLVVAASVELAGRGVDTAFCFNRKETKDHGEKGLLVGHQPQDGERVLIVEDVTTAGTSIQETVPVLKAAAQVEIAGLIVSVDRQECGPNTAPQDRTALQYLAELHSMQTMSIVTVREIISYLHNREIGGQVLIDDSQKNKMLAYLQTWGPTASELANG